MTILVTAIVASVSFLAGWIIYAIGYSAGYHDGRENEIDNSAARFARTNRNKI